MYSLYMGIFLLFGGLIMKIMSSESNGLLRLCFTGELDHHGAKRAITEIGEQIDSSLPRDCIIDLGGLTFMDSSGIAVILKTYRRMHDIGGRTRVENVPAQPMRVLDASGLDRMVSITAAR